MELVSAAATGLVALFGVVLGGWITSRNQDRIWRREHEGKWRDVRLSSYLEFVSAYRQYVAYATNPDAKIIARPHPRRPGVMMPTLAEDGRTYQEQLDTASVQVRLVSQMPETVIACAQVVHHARQIAAAARAVQGGDETSTDEIYPVFFEAQNRFLNAVRRELDLTAVDWSLVRDAQ